MTRAGADNRPLVLGGGMVRFGRYGDGSGFRDWVRDAAREAVRDAGLEMRDIDALVVASESDFFSLQLSPAAVLGDDLGLNGCAVIRVEGGGGSGGAALREGTMQILSGLARRVLLVGFEMTGRHLAAQDVRLLYGLSFDADIDGMAGLTAANLYALSALAHMQRYGTTQEQLAHVSVKNHGNATLNPLAHLPMEITIADVLASPVVSTPYRRLDCSALSDGAAALVLCHPDAAPALARPVVRVAGTGCATDHLRLGDRDAVHAFSAKTLSAQRAYHMAGIGNPGAGIDCAEVYDAFTGAELQGLEALGLCAQGRAGGAMLEGRFDRDGALPVNLSGGLLGQGGAPGAVGLAQAVTMQRLLQGRYWPGLQPTRELCTGLVDCHGGVATVNYTHVLERLG